ncbi:hypothetical protein [Vreelandella nanhaiensis]|uniref:Uncharacterized protein n=1 Tax=Vreelandella nanhaiensis TaxID=1258546 RepID=A0A3S0W824_9GAMM|nr:hypothetical protein [Halomonas nanhaiensis]RUR34311.1 hypothetical protein ELY38_01545 [Halomonas nanhaiensis]
MGQQIVFIIGLAAVHVFANKLRKLSAVPRSAWLSWAGGISVAYVFIHVFPALSEAHQTINDHGLLAILEHNAYIVALIGLAAFYGLEQVATRHSQPYQQGVRTNFRKLEGVFWIHVGSFSLYNALIGYLLVYRDNHFPDVVFFFLAMSAHFLVNDHGLVRHHRERYLAKGRWVLASAVVVGWLVGVMVEVTEAFVSLLYAFVAGGLVLNVLKEELPEDRRSRFWPFALGLAGSTVLLVFAEP